MAARLKVLAIAVATGRIGYVYLMGEKMRDWGISRKASKSPTLAAAQTQRWINRLKPDVLVTEAIDQHSKKGQKSRNLIGTVARTAEQNYLLDVSVKCPRPAENKYEDAKALAERFPELLPWLPKKRRIWEPEPRNTIYFEALALALQIIDRGEGDVVSPA